MAVLAALGITRPVCALTLHWRANEVATVTVEEPMSLAEGSADVITSRLSRYVLTPAAAHPQEASHAG